MCIHTYIYILLYTYIKTLPQNWITLDGVLQMNDFRGPLVPLSLRYG